MKYISVNFLGNGSRISWWNFRYRQKGTQKYTSGDAFNEMNNHSPSHWIPTADVANKTATCTTNLTALTQWPLCLITQVFPFIWLSVAYTYFLMENEVKGVTSRFFFFF